MERWWQETLKIFETLESRNITHTFEENERWRHEALRISETGTLEPNITQSLKRWNREASNIFETSNLGTTKHYTSLQLWSR